MDAPVVRTFSSEAEWQAALATPPPGAGVLRDLGKTGEGASELVRDAANFIGGALARHGFHLFRNGGLPLLERTAFGFKQEILLRPGANSIRGAYAPITVDLHVSDPEVGRIRARYAGPPTHVSTRVVSGPLGRLATPPEWPIWNVALGQDALRPLAEWIQHLAVPYLRVYGRPGFAKRLWEESLPGLTPATTLELLLAHYGPVEARSFLHAQMERDHDLAAAIITVVEACGRAQAGRTTVRSDGRALGLIAYHYDLLLNDPDER